MSLTQLIDRDHPYVYLEGMSGNHCSPIRRFENNTLFIDFYPELLASKEVAGFFLLKNDAGILLFNGHSEEIQDKSKLFDVYPIHINPESYEKLNRRQFIRLKLEQNAPCRIVDAYEKSFDAKIVDVSAGGLGLIVDESLDLRKDYHIELPLESMKEQKLKAIFHPLVHSGQMSDSGLKIGAQFKSFFRADRTIKRFYFEDYMTRAINKELIRMRNKSNQNEEESED